MKFFHNLYIFSVFYKWHVMLMNWKLVEHNINRNNYLSLHMWLIYEWNSFLYLSAFLNKNSFWIILKYLKYWFTWIIQINCRQSFNDNQFISVIHNSNTGVFTKIQAFHQFLLYTQVFILWRLLTFRLIP